VFAYAHGPISGSHINPAVSFAIALSGHLSWGEAFRDWIAPFIGATLGAAGLVFVFGGAGNGLGATVPTARVSNIQAMVLEAILTFLLVNTILHTAVKKEGTPFAGLAIGLTLVAAILMGGPLTGASLNPARTFGSALFAGSLNVVWVCITGTGLGASLAVWDYKALT